MTSTTNKVRTSGASVEYGKKKTKQLSLPPQNVPAPPQAKKEQKKVQFDVSLTSNTETQETPIKDTTPDKDDGSEIEFDDML